jgi:hypothetical protein
MLSVLLAMQTPSVQVVANVTSYYIERLEKCLKDYGAEELPQKRSTTLKA